MNSDNCDNGGEEGCHDGNKSHEIAFIFEEPSVYITNATQYNVLTTCYNVRANRNSTLYSILQYLYHTI